VTTRRYTVEVIRHQRQTVTFVADPKDNADLIRTAARHCDPAEWSVSFFDIGDLTSRVVAGAALDAQDELP